MGSYGHTENPALQGKDQTYRWTFANLLTGIQHTHSVVKNMQVLV